MGQKVNPHGLRVGVIKDWDSRWFTSKRDFGDTLVEDYKLRKQLKSSFTMPAFPKLRLSARSTARRASPVCASPFTARSRAW